MQTSETSRKEIMVLEDSKTHPASEDSAVSEKPSSPQIAESSMISQNAFTGILEYGFPPPGPRQRNIPGKRKHHARRVDALRGTGDVLHDDYETPYREHAPLAKYIEEELAHGQWERRSEKVGYGCGREGGCDVE